MLTKAISYKKEAETVCPEFPLHPQRSMICSQGEGLRAPCKPREAQGGEKELGRSLSLRCQGLDPPGAPLPSLSPPGQDWDEESQENKGHILPCEAEASAGGTMASLRSKRAGPRLGTKAESQLDGSPPPLTKVSGEHACRVLGGPRHLPPHLRLLSPPPLQLQESSLMALPRADPVLFQARPLLKNMPLPSFPRKCA